MKGIFFILVLVAISVAFTQESESQNIRKKWMDFKVKFNKNYDSAEEESKRFAIFTQSLKKAAEYQAQNPLAKFGVTKFSDLTPEEHASLYRIPDLKNKLNSEIPSKNFSAPSKPNVRGCTPDPTNYDWNTCGVVTPVYNNGQCGSCWAFAAVETVESYYAIGGGQLTPLSVEQVLDCDTAGEDQGCYGGFPNGAYTYIESQGGIEALSDYPYVAGEGQVGKCQFNAKDVVTTVTNFQAIDSEENIYAQVSSASGGPVTICVDTTSWQYYEGGVVTVCGTNVDCCAQVTGYKNYGKSGAYWIVRNSWGTNWGVDGYIWIAAGHDLCGFSEYASIASTTH